MWIYLLACQAEQTEALQIDTRPRVQLFESRISSQPMVQKYSCTLEAQSDVVVSTLVGGRIKTIYASEGEQLSEGSLVLSLDAEQASAQKSLASAGVEDAKAMLVEAQNNLERLQALSSNTAEVDLERAQTGLKRSEAGLKAAEAQLRLATAQFNEHHIQTPFGGEVVEIFPQTGSLIGAGQPAFRLVNSERLKSTIGISSADRHALEIEGASISVQINGVQYPAQIDSAPTASASGGLSWHLNLSLERPEAVLPGTSGKAILSLSPPNADALVHIDTLSLDGQLMSVGPEGTISVHSVEAVAEHGEWLYVNGVSPETKLIIHPNSDWEDGQAVVVLEPAQ